MTEFLEIQDVAPRDGLQMHPDFIETDQKIHLISALVESGIKRMELSSFVSPRAIPQMANAPELFAEIGQRLPGHDAVEYMALVVNEKGYDRAVSSGAKAITAVIACSETLSQRNSRQSLEEATDYTCRVLRRAKADGIKTRVTLGVAWVCPYEGQVPEERILKLADTLWEHGADELALADTIGHASPLAVGRLCEAVGHRTDMAQLAVHLHDTLAFGLANAAAAISAGVRKLDASTGGLGGCPFAPGSAGNLATEDLVLMAEKMGFETGISLDALHGAVRVAQTIVDRPLGGRTRPWWTQRKQRS